MSVNVLQIDRMVGIILAASVLLSTVPSHIGMEAPVFRATMPIRVCQSGTGTN